MDLEKEKTYLPNVSILVGGGHEWSGLLDRYVLVFSGAETDDVDEADAVEPDGDAADDTGGVVPVGDGLEGGVVN